MTLARISDPSASRAVLIGVHSYKHAADLPDIPQVGNNLTGLADVLTDPAIWGLPGEHVTRLLQPESAADMLDAVLDAGARTTDTLLVYYAGHGLTGAHSDELYLALPESRKFRPDTAFRYGFLREAVSELSARRVVVILDCCWSGRAIHGAMGGESGLADLAAVSGRCVLTASAATQAAQAPPGETYTAFTGVLLRLLAEGLPGQPEYLDMQTVYAQARVTLQAQSRPLPELGSSGNAGLICIARNQSELRAPNPRPEAPELPDLPALAPPQHGQQGPLPARMTALVRECLLCRPQSRRLHVIRPGFPESREVQKARVAHRLEQWEDLIAIWQWGWLVNYFRAAPNSLAFTSRGICVVKGKQRLNIPYEEFHQYSFDHKRYEVHHGNSSHMSFRLLINGPLPWTSPSCDDWGTEHVAAALNAIKKIAAG